MKDVVDQYGTVLRIGDKVRVRDASYIRYVAGGESPNLYDTLVWDPTKNYHTPECQVVGFMEGGITVGPCRRERDLVLRIPGTDTLVLTMSMYCHKYSKPRVVVTPYANLGFVMRKSTYPFEFVYPDGSISSAVVGNEGTYKGMYQTLGWAMTHAERLGYEVEVRDK